MLQAVSNDRRPYHLLHSQSRKGVVSGSCRGSQNFRADKSLLSIGLLGRAEIRLLEAMRRRALQAVLQYLLRDIPLQEELAKSVNSVAYPP